MKVFIWDRVEQLTTNYHSEGGLVVFAESLERARELAKSSVDGCELRDDEMPTDTRDVTGGSEAVYVMPDAGCC